MHLQDTSTWPDGMAKADECRSLRSRRLLSSVTGAEGGEERPNELLVNGANPVRLSRHHPTQVILQSTGEASVGISELDVGMTGDKGPVILHSLEE